ncbi:MAG: hypothetical protein ACI9JN_001759 [Bacteroidia bacterium]|jgi:hypothetical protein
MSYWALNRYFRTARQSVHITLVVMFVQQFRTKMESITMAFMDSFKHLSPAQINYKPISSVWSVAQNIEHLTKISDSYLPSLSNISDGTNPIFFMGKMKWWRTMCGNMILKSVSPDRVKKIKTFPIWQPAMSDSTETILEDFAENQKQFVEVIENNKSAIESGVAVGSPGNPNIVYTMLQALDIIVTHQKRHLQQAKEMLPLIEAYDQT